MEAKTLKTISPRLHSPLASFRWPPICCSLSQKRNAHSSSPPNNKLLQVVLVSPQIPGNTGCIARTCAASAVGLHLVGPMGFRVDDAKVKRAGLDYWPYPPIIHIATFTLIMIYILEQVLHCILGLLAFIPSLGHLLFLPFNFNVRYVVLKVHDSWAEFREFFMQQEGEKRLLAITKRGTAVHSDFRYRRGDYLIFGSETSGLPPEALDDCKGQSFGGGTIRIPMVETYVRCLNLSVSVGIALYEASRQLNYEQLEAAAGSQPSIVTATEDIFA